MRSATLLIYTLSLSFQTSGVSLVSSETGACVIPVEVDGWLSTGGMWTSTGEWANSVDVGWILAGGMVWANSVHVGSMLAGGMISPWHSNGRSSDVWEHSVISLYISGLLLAGGIACVCDVCEQMFFSWSRNVKTFEGSSSSHKLSLESIWRLCRHFLATRLVFASVIKPECMVSSINGVLG